jgi:hypothetical protein
LTHRPNSGAPSLIVIYHLIMIQKQKQTANSAATPIAASGQLVVSSAITLNTIFLLLQSQYLDAYPQGSL